MNPMRTAAHVERFATTDGCFADTGFQPELIAEMWTKYNAHGGSTAGTFGAAPGQLKPCALERRAFYFYCVFVLIHKHPQNNWSSQFTSRNLRCNLRSSQSSALNDDDNDDSDPRSKLTRQACTPIRRARGGPLGLPLLPGVPPKLGRQVLPPMGRGGHRCATSREWWRQRWP